MPDENTAELREIRASALEEFAAEICDRNAELGLTEPARHFGRAYARLARVRAVNILSGEIA